MTNPSGKKNDSATGIIEEAIHFLRMAPSGILFTYYLGSLPFILGFLFFWGDMSHNAYALEYCSAASLGLAILFVWMKCWQSVFTIKVYEAISVTSISHWSMPTILRMISLQTFIQTLGFIVLPIALLITIPYPWVFAFYQNVLVQDYREKKSLREITGRTASLNNFRHQQNYLAISTLYLFQLFVLLNTGVALYTLPFLLKIFTGIETIVTMGGFSYFNTTFLVTAMALTYLCTDPIIKTVYTMRLFYADSEKTGADLKADLKRIKAKSGLMIVIFFLMIPIFIHPDNSFGNTSNASNSNKTVQKTYDSTPDKIRQSRSATKINPETLNKSIEEVLNRREFAWRTPAPKDTDSNKQGFIGNFIDWLKPYLKSVIKTLKKWGDSFATWIENLLPDAEIKNSEKKKDSGAMIKYFLFALLALTTGILLFAIAKILLFKAKTAETEDDTAGIVPDISDENIKADDMPADHWIELAMTLADKGDFRLSMRALYLGTLARLAETRFITIARYKSNREYENELSRRFHENKEIIQTFSETVNVFDRVWYGVHNLTREDIDLFAENQMRIVNFANQ